jgi:hypothetical protein
MRPVPEGSCHRGAQKPHPEVHAIGIRDAVIDVEDIQDKWCVAATPAPPGGPGQQAVTAQGDPHPLGTSAAGRKVVRQFLVEDIGQPGEEAEFFASGDRTDGQVVLFHG